jgi:hypothetical protein
VSDIDIAVADSLKVLDLKRPIREATYSLRGPGVLVDSARRCLNAALRRYGPIQPI